MSRTRAELAENLLRTKGRFTMGEIARDYPEMVYTIRNGVSECKTKLAGEGYRIDHIWGKTWAENAYVLVKVEPPKEGEQTVMMVCHGCGVTFPARARDVKEGNGRFHSRKCAGRFGGRKSQASRKESKASQVVPAAQRALL